MLTSSQATLILIKHYDGTISFSIIVTPVVSPINIGSVMPFWYPSALNVLFVPAGILPIVPLQLPLIKINSSSIGVAIPGPVMIIFKVSISIA